MLKNKLNYISLKKCIIFIVLVLFAFTIQNCKKKTEKEEYESLKDSLKYKTYSTVSKNVIPPVITVYNNNRKKDLPAIEEDVVRLLLAYSWAIMQKSTIAVAEGNIAEGISKDNDMKFLCHSVISIALYEKGWKNIAFDESNKANDLIQKNPDGKYTLEKIMAFHLILATVSIYKDDWKAARFHFAGFGNVTQIHWPYQIFDALVDIKENNVQQGLVKLKKISEDKTVPQEVRITIGSGIKKIESESGPVDSKLFWPRTISVILFKELKNAGSAGIQKVAETVDEITKKIPKKVQF